MIDIMVTIYLGVVIFIFLIITFVMFDKVFLQSTLSDYYSDKLYSHLNKGGIK